MAISALMPLSEQLRSLVGGASKLHEHDGVILERWMNQRDAAAFNVLIARHGNMVWRVASSLLRHSQDAEDVFQATFLVLARKARSLCGRASLAGWLYRTAYHLAYQVRGKRILKSSEAHLAARTSSRQPIDDISLREAQSIITDELQKLPEAYREVVLLCLLDGATLDEAALRLGCSLSTIKRRRNRGRALLQRRLARRGLTTASALTICFAMCTRAPAQAIRQTAAAANRLAAGQPVAGAAATLAQQASSTYLALKTTLMLLVLGPVCAVGLASYQASTGAGDSLPEQRVEHLHAQVAEGRPPGARVDAQSNPLPAGAVARIGSLAFRHSNPLNRLAFTSNGSGLATVCSDGRVRLWDVGTGKLRWASESCNGSFTQDALVIGKDGTSLAAANASEISLFDNASGTVIGKHSWSTLKEDDGTCIAIAPDLKTFARSSTDGTVGLFDTLGGKEQRRFKAFEPAPNETFRTIAFSSDSARLVAATRQKKSVNIYDAASGALRRCIELKDPWIRTIDFSADFHFMVVTSAGDGARLDSLNVTLYDLDTDKQRSLQSTGFVDPRVMAFSPGNKILAVGGQGKNIVLLDVASGAELRRLPWHPNTVALAFSPDGKILASSDSWNAVALWDVASGRILPGSSSPLGHLFGLSCFSFSKNGRELRTIFDEATVWDAESGKPLRTLVKQTEWWWGKSISPDEKLVATPSDKADVILIDTATGKTVHTLRGHQGSVIATAFSSDGTMLFTGGFGDRRVTVWDTATGKAIRELMDHKEGVDRITVSHDGRWLATAASVSASRTDKEIRIWEVATGKLIRRLEMPTGSVSGMAFSSDSTLLAASGGAQSFPKSVGAAALWDVNSGKAILSMSGPWDSLVECVAISPDNRSLATGGPGLRLWEVASGRERRQVAAHEATVRALDFSSDGMRLAAASADAPVLIWDVYDQEKRRPQELSPVAKDRIREQLSDANAEKAFAAICDLIARGNESVSYLRDLWKQQPRRAITEADRLQRERMLEVLEHVGTAEARRFLEELTQQAEDLELAKAAKNSLQRMSKDAHAP